VGKACCFPFPLSEHVDSLLPVGLYGYETWSVTLNEEQRLRMLENRVQRRIFGVKRGKITRDWRKMSSKELQNLCPS